MSSAAEARIVARGVSKWWREVMALSDVSLSLGPGIHGLVGPNGAGKSTLLAILAGVVRPSRGEVRVLGADPSAERAVRARIGYAPHGTAGYDEVAAVELVAWLLRFDGLDGPRARERARAAIELVGLGPVAERPFGALSRGMKQRLKVAQALAHDPEVVLLDEPFEGCDPLAKESLRAALEDVAGRGRTIVLSSHVLHELEPLVDRVVIVGHGRILADDDVDGLVARAPARPRRLRLVVTRPRELGARLVAEGRADGLRLGADGALELETADPAALRERIEALVLAGELELERLEAPDERLESRYHEALGRTEAS